MERNELAIIESSTAHGVTHTTVAARVPMAVRPGTMADVPFIDAMQKADSRSLGFLPTMAIEGKIRLGQVLVAEANALRNADCGLRNEDGGTSAFSSNPQSEICNPQSVGYLIAADRYFKRDEIGYVTQIGVLPEYRRSLVAGQLLQAQFDRSAYGCKLYCCWCAQDLKANEFWEAMGFVPVAFRTGARKKGKDRSARIHLFWQKRIRANDTTTPWWYPAQTGGGEMREDRLVFPILPGTCWREVMPVVLPERVGFIPTEDGRAGNGGDEPHPALKKPKRKKKPPVPKRPDGVPPGGFWFAEEYVEPEPTAEELAAEAAYAAAKQAMKKVDPRLTAMARELRDRWQEQSPRLIATAAKHDLKRIEAATSPALPMNAIKAIEQAA